MGLTLLVFLPCICRLVYQLRRRVQKPSTLASYYILDGTIYQAPTVEQVITSRLVHMDAACACKQIHTSASAARVYLCSRAGAHCPASSLAVALICLRYRAGQVCAPRPSGDEPVTREGGLRSQAQLRVALGLREWCG
jgi:hypothetical protein|eukprot:COSAG01_NODE_638_length_14605_cov_46.266097_10_plen_138_part_00